MTIPASAPYFPEPLDPADVQDFVIQLSRGSASTDVLRPTELVTNFTVALSAESVAAGLQILTTQGYQTGKLDDGSEVCEICFWLTVDPAKRQQSMFSAGVLLGIDLNYKTNNVPARERHQTQGLWVRVR